MRGRRIAFFFAAAALVLGLSFDLVPGLRTEVRAQSILAGGVIGEVRVEGVQRIEPETVQSYMQVKAGDPFDPIRLDRALKRIYATGIFADVTLRRDGSTLIVIVVENPIINRIAFEGNKRIADDTLLNEIQLKPRLVFTRTKVQRDAQRVLEVYRRSGRFAATVVPKVIQLEQNRVDLVFEISEGPLTTIEAINFIGNEVFSDGDLEDQISTSEYAFWNILATSDTYDPDRLTFDRELLRRFYLGEGYADFKVVSVVAELTESRESFIVTFTVDEGERYTFADFEIASEIRNLDPQTLRESVTFQPGDWYDAGEVDKTVDALTDRVGDLGFAFVEIDPDAERDTENRTIKITFGIQEGPRVYVERIDIEGNIRTLDHVIRREFKLVEGDAFNASKLRRSRQRIQNLGFFQTVDIENEPGSEEDRTVITVNVEEQSTGDLSFGFGFSSSRGPIGNVGIQERNLLGRGQDLRFNITLAGEATQANISFTEPYFLDRNLSAGFDIFRITNEQDESSFDLERIGGSLRAGYNVTENLRHVVRYTLEQRDIKDVSSSASIVVRAEEGETVRSFIGQELIYDVRDSRFSPRDGYVLRIGSDVAGLGGDAKYFKPKASGAYFYSIEDWTFSVRGEGGKIIGLGEDTRISDRFFIGGSNPRGFEFAGIGPRDALTNDSLGAENYYITTLETSFPLGLPEDLDIRGRLFSDISSAWDADTSGFGFVLQDSSSPRVTLGTGLSWNSPFGPVVVDLGFAVVKESFDETEILSFSFGTQF